jgi:hypothetical protein
MTVQGSIFGGIHELHRAHKQFLEGFQAKRFRFARGGFVFVPAGFRQLSQLERIVQAAKFKHRRNPQVFGLQAAQGQEESGEFRADQIQSGIEVDTGILCDRIGYLFATDQREIRYQSRINREAIKHGA